MALKPYDLRRRLYIIFRGEEGLDYGGLARFVLILFFYMYIPYCSHVVKFIIIVF